VKQFHPLQVVGKTAETADSVRIALAVPDDLKAEFDFMPGQHLPIELLQEGKRLRRTYSICSAKGEWPLQIGVRVQPGGQFSTYVDDELAVGDTLQVMPPTGRFHANLDAANEKFYLGVAAGSGITPVLSIIASILQAEPGSRCALFYGNRKQSTTMFIEDLYALKNRFLQRLQLHFVFSREDQEFPVAAGRIDAAKVRELVERLCAGATIDEAFVCGPDTMIAATQQALLDCGLSEQQVHSERFGVARQSTAVPAEKSVMKESVAEADQSTVTVIMDGHKKTFVMPRKGASIVDAAATHGIELPYSCKGGVCATCRTHLREGAVTMANNYGLEPWEVEEGYVLACQSQPQSDKLTLDYDKS
jgi:ring-1,2-phenylacetyl-CoA epoxidase subunit PaaE